MNDKDNYTIHRELHINLNGVYVSIEWTMDMLHDTQVIETFSETQMQLSNLNGDDDGYDISGPDEQGWYTSKIELPIDVVPLIEEERVVVDLLAREGNEE